MKIAVYKTIAVREVVEVDDKFREMTKPALTEEATANYLALEKELISLIPPMKEEKALVWIDGIWSIDENGEDDEIMSECPEEENERD